MSFRAVRNLLLATAILGLLLVGPGLVRRASAQRNHTVRAGQSLALIARRYRVGAADLAAANRMRTGDTLRTGQVLRVPARGVVYVRPGQTLSHIARQHRVGVRELARANRMRVEGRLRAGQRLMLPGFARASRQPAVPRDWGQPQDAGLVRIRAGDRLLSIRLRDKEGRVPREALQALSSVMADETPSAEGRLPDPRLALLLAAISDHFGGRELVLVSGFREARGRTRRTSRHVSGRATDVQVLGVPHRQVWDYCRSVANTGCGLYPRSVFVHLDVRDSPAQWVDWSGPGQRARYGTLRGPQRRRSRARPQLGRRVTRPEAVPLEVEVSGESPTETPRASTPAPASPSASRHQGSGRESS